MTSQTIEPAQGNSPLDNENPTPCSSDLSQKVYDFVWFDRFPNPLRRPGAAIVWVAELLIGSVILLTILSITASLPVLNFIALGYLLDSEAQIARRGTIRCALPLLPAAVRLGAIGIGISVSLVPVLLLADAAADARLIARNGTEAQLWMGTLVVVSIIVVVHILFALARGGTLLCFVRPIKNVRCFCIESPKGEYWSRADRVLQRFLAAVRPWFYFWLGVRVFFTTWIWLALPTLLLSFWWEFNSSSVRSLVLVIVGACLIPILSWVPMLQIRLATENRWRAMFELGCIRELFRNAPFAWLISIASLYAFSVPLFLYSLNFRMHAPFRADIWWDLSFVSICCSIPARFLLGWAYHRASVRGPAWGGWIWTSRIVLAGSLVFYLLLLFQTPLTHESPSWQLDHHSLVLPIPF